MRESGILLHISSLPEKGGIGTMGSAAYEFVDFLKDTGMKIWQVLPIGPTGFGESPYQCASAFAGNPLLIDLKFLVRDGLLTPDQLPAIPDGDRVDFAAVRAGWERALRAAFARSHAEAEIEDFQQKNPWAADYALFMALKTRFHGISWQGWPDEIRLRKEEALEKYRSEMRDEISFHLFVQALFFRQWFALRQYANKNGIELMGDIPIYVAEDSADAWATPEYFQLDAQRRPTRVAGVPPDYFSADGQLWGNPLYDWKYLKKQHFSWWVERLRFLSLLYDRVRVDHFIGFANYYSIPYGAKTAREGKWVKAPGIRLFRTIRRQAPEIRIIAEDLGEVNARVKRLLRFCGFPGMKVLTFAFDGGPDNPHRPEHYTRNTVAYTGTHDNDTALGFWQNATEEQREAAMRLLQIGPQGDAAGKMIEAVFASAADTAIIPMQDFLRLPSTARMNTPGTVGGNWQWRMPRMPQDAVKAEIKSLVRKSGREGERI